MTNTVSKKYLSDLSIFNDVDITIITELTDHANKKVIMKDSAVFNQGDRREYFYVLIYGRLKNTHLTRNGNRIISDIFNPGDMFGFTLSDRVFYSGTPIAVVDCTVFYWPNRMMTELFPHSPRLSLNIIKMMERQLFTANLRLREKYTQDAEQRVANTILRLIEGAGVKAQNAIEIDFPISKSDIGELSGTTLHTVSRIISNWRENGWVESGRLILKVRNLECLEVIAKQNV